MSRGRGIENRGVVLAPVEQIADRAQRGNLVDAWRSQLNQLPHRFLVKLNLQLRATRQRGKQIVSPGTIALLQFFKLFTRIDFHCVEILNAGNSSLKLSYRFIETIRQRVGRVSGKNKELL